MALDKVWVVAEATSEGKPTSITFELLTKARAANVYTDGERVAELDTHPGLVPLHGRPAFDKLRKELGGK